MSSGTFAPIPISERHEVVRRPRKILGWALAFLAANFVMGVLAAQLRVIASVHGVITVLVAFGLAFLSKKLEWIVAAAAYCAMCDVFWRMNSSIMPWEGSKYLTLAVLMIAFFRFVRRPQRIQAPVAYLVLLLPAAAITLVAVGPQTTRDLVSQNLAGPVMLGVGVMLLRQIIATERELRIVMWTMIGAISAVSGVVLYTSIALGALNFSETKSNFAASGGFGPNQVSNLLGVGALLCILLCLAKVDIRSLVAQLLIALALLAQAALTFSRGGLYSVAAAGIAVFLVTALARGMRTRLLIGLVVVSIAAVIAYPIANDFTDGALEQRFADTSSTNRGDIANADLELFWSAPVTGVGVGMAKYERANTEVGFIEARSHTEFSRLLGEHGVLGLAVVGLLIVMAVQGVRASITNWNRILATAFSAWALTTMAHSGTSVAAISFVFALSQIRLSAAPGRARRAGPAVRLSTGRMQHSEAPKWN